MSQESTPRVEVSEDGPVARQVEVEVPAARVRKAFERAYKQLARTARVRGFRPGKVPRSVLQRMYGPALSEDIERTLVGETLGEALEQSELVPVSEPSIDAEAPQQDAPFVYRARVEVRPEFELGELEGLPVTRPDEEVTDEQVEAELESLRQRQASLVEEPEDAVAANGHLLSIDFDGSIDGEPFEGGSGKGVTLELGAGQFIAGFDEQLEGVRAGESRTVRAQFPDDYQAEHLAGKAADFDVRVESIKRRDVPDLDDEFAKDLGDFETLDELRAKLRESLEAQRKREVEAAVRRSLLDALIERTPFEVPPGMVAERVQRRIHSARHDLEGRGMPANWIDAQAAGWEESWRPSAEREIRESWLLEAVAKQREIEVEDEAVAVRLEELVQAEAAEGGDPQRLRRAWREAGLDDAVRRQLAEERAVEFLLGEAKVESTAGA